MNIPRYWRTQGARYRLEGQRHRETGEIRFPPQPAQLDQANDSWEPVVLSGHGKLYSFSVVRQAPTGFEGQAPYLLGMIKLAEGPLVTAMLCDCEASDLAIGMMMEMVTRRLRDTGPDGVLVYGYKFRPRLDG